MLFLLWFFQKKAECRKFMHGKPYYFAMLEEMFQNVVVDVQLHASMVRFLGCLDLKKRKAKTFQMMPLLKKKTLAAAPLATPVATRGEAAQQILAPVLMAGRPLKLLCQISCRGW